METLKKTKAQLAVYRQAVLKEAFEGRLTLKFREENGLPEWKNVSITQAIVQKKNALKAGPFGSALKKDCYVPNGYKVYGQEQVIAGNESIGDYYIDEDKYQELISCAIVPHDILISLVGTVGKVLVLSDNCLPGIINPRLIKVTLDKKIMIPYFFKYYFESAYLKSLYKEKAHGATMDVLNMGMIKELPFPNMSEQTSSIISKVWGMCGPLRDDGVSYGDYLEQLTYLIFLKMSDEYSKPPYRRETGIPEGYGWTDMNTLTGADLEEQYKKSLEKLGEQGGILGQIFKGAINKVSNAAILYRIVQMIDREKWVSMSSDVKGEIYEGLLQKNAEDVKSGAGQYFTPRALIQAMVACIRPEPMKTIADIKTPTLIQFNYLH